MKKLDLHIHTIPTQSDSEFEFDIDTFKEYVSTLNIDGVAITNHNHFDLEQFKTIASFLDPVVVLPGIELDIEGGHMLLISDAANLDDFKDKADKVEQAIPTNRDSISVDKFKEIYGNLGNYLLIPHYNKKPRIGKETLNLLSRNINSGEVNSPGKFIRCKKLEETLTPVYFSDIRIKKDAEFSTRQTHFNIEDINVRTIKACLNDKTQVALTAVEGSNLFQATEDGLTLSSGLNIILGGRSSGKTYTLKKVLKGLGGNSRVKYIEQFHLTQKDEKTQSELLSSLIDSNKESQREEYLSELKDITNHVRLIDLNYDEKKIDEFIETLKAFAREQERQDTFAKTKLFSEPTYRLDDTNTDELEKLIGATTNLLEANIYHDLIDTIVTRKDLLQLVLTLIDEYRKEKTIVLSQKWVNDLMHDIKNELSANTSATQPIEVSLIEVVQNLIDVEKFKKLTKLAGNSKELSTKSISDFKIRVETKKISGAQQLKNISKTALGFSQAYERFSDPYEFLCELKNIGIDPTTYYRYFVDIAYEILNKYDMPVSGGEYAEFMLLTTIQDSLKYDALLIDEPESSFDNLFLRESINKKLKEIATKVPVVVVTHNSTVGASIKPEYVIHTERNVDRGRSVSFEVYEGYPSDLELKSLSGKTKKHKDVALNYLEGGETAYQERGGIYEALNN